MRMRPGWAACALALALGIAAAVTVVNTQTPAVADDQAPFRNPDLPDRQRLADLVGRLTLDEKIVALGTNPEVPRLGIKGARHVEGLHGLAYGGPSNWGSRN